MHLNTQGIDPLIRVLRQPEATDQRIAGGTLGPEARKGRTLTTGYVIGRNEEAKIFDFAVLSELFRYWILINP